MAFANGVAQVGGTPALIFEPTITGLALVQNQGAGTVTLGGPNVSYGAGVNLPASSLTPLQVPIAHYGSQADADDGLYGVAAGGTVNVGWLAPA